MNVLLLAMLLLPFLAQDGPEGQAEAARLSTGFKISAAAQAARAYTPPAWIADARRELADSPVYCDDIVRAVQAASAETGLDAELLWSVMFTESHGRHYRDNGTVKRGGAGEIGAMQIKPFWRRGLKREYGITVDLYDLSDNIRAGAWILKQGGKEPRVMLSYYNTGQRLNNTPYQRKVMRYRENLGRSKEI